MPGKKPRKPGKRARKVVRRVKRVVRGRAITPSEKGHLFEEVVERYFQLLGYDVERNARINGASGVTHEVDVLVSKGGVLGVVEAKNYSKPVPKEWIMKAAGVARDIEAQEVYVVSASGFTDDAVKVAEIMGVKLLNLDDMIRELRRAVELEKLETYYVSPVYSVKSAKEFASKFVERRFFRSVEEIENVELLYHPFYVFNAEYVYREGVRGKIVERWRKLSIVACAFTQCIPIVGKGAVIHLLEVPSLSRNVAELLRVLNSFDKPVSIKELEEKTGWSKQKIYRFLQELEEKGLVKYEEDMKTGVKMYHSVAPTIEDLLDTHDTVIPPESELIGGVPNGIIIETKTFSKNVASILTTLYGGQEVLRIESVKLVYIPIYRVKLVSVKDGSYRYIHFLATTKRPLVLEVLGGGTS